MSPSACVQCRTKLPACPRGSSRRSQTSSNCRSGSSARTGRSSRAAWWSVAISKSRSRSIASVSPSLLIPVHLRNLMRRRLGGIRASRGAALLETDQGKVCPSRGSARQNAAAQSQRRVQLPQRPQTCRPVAPQNQLSSSARAAYCAGAPIATGRTGEPEPPEARNGRIIVHDSQTLSFAIAARLAF